MPQQPRDYCPNCTPQAKVTKVEIDPNSTFGYFNRREVWASMKVLANHNAKDVHVLEPKFVKMGCK